MTRDRVLLYCESCGHQFWEQRFWYEQYGAECEMDGAECLEVESYD